jgi:predicted SAM-dependent methyltransferase
MAKLSAAELAKREDVIQKMKKNKRSLVKRYGPDAEKVMYGRATNIAKKVAETQMEKSNLKELVRAALMQEKKFPDLTGDGKVTKADILKGRGVDIKEGPEDRDWATYVKSLVNDIRINGVDGYTDYSEDDFIADYEEYIGGKMDLDEDLDLGHQDDEPHMLKGDLYRIGKYAMELYQMVDQFEGMGEVDFPHWWQAKIIKAKEMISSAKHYLDFETKEPEIDAMVGAIDMSGALDNVGVDEGLPKGYFKKATAELDESFEKLVGKLKKGGKSEKAAKAIAGAVASYKAKGGGKGPTAKQKARG